MQAAHKLVHLFGGRQRTLVHHIEPELARVWPLASGQNQTRHGAGKGSAHVSLRGVAGCKNAHVWTTANRSDIVHT